MPVFLDTSSFMKYFVEESGSKEVSELISSETLLWVSELTMIEGASALAKKVRKTEISSDEFRSFLRALTLFFDSGRCQIVPLDDVAKERARLLLSTWALSRQLSSLDALHLAGALRIREEVSPSELQFYSSDRRLLEAARGHGFTVRLPGVS